MTTIIIPTETPTATVGHRAPGRLNMPDWGAAGWAGLISGTLFMLCELVLLPYSKGGNAWVPVRMVAAVVFGRETLPTPPYFAQAAAPSSGAFFMAVALHYSLAIIFARILSTMIYRVDRRTALTAGAFFGLILYAVNFYAATAAFPWFAAARGWASLLSNVVFGASAALLYKAFETREPLMEDEPEPYERLPRRY